MPLFTPKNSKKKANDKTSEANNKDSKVKETKKISAKDKKASTKEKSAPAPKKTKVKKKKKTGTEFKLLSGLLMKKLAHGGAARLSSKADEVNQLNVFPVPDGDTGDNMRMTIEAGINAIETLDSNDLADVMKVFSHGMLLGARGNSGVILSQFFKGMADGLKDTHKASPKVLASALEKAVERAYTSVMTPTEGTILTVAREAVEYAVARITPSSTIRSFFADLAKEMHASLDRTPELLPALKEAGVVDSGGAGLFYIIDGFNRVLNGEKVNIKPSTEKAKEENKIVSFENFDPDTDMKFGYCTELLVKLQKSKVDIDSFDIEAFKDFLASVGDSIVAFRTEDVLKLHVHTFTPEKVLMKAREYGEFLTVKIENMSLQHTELSEANEEETLAKEEKKAEEPSPKKRYGVVTVSSGDGLSELFSELGADVIIRGGQTNNPSTSDFIEAFDKINAEHIFVFPNNGNIVMASEQAAEMYEKAKIHVIETKSVGTGYVALSSLDFDNENVDEVTAALNEAVARTTSGYVSPSIRDADIDGVHIHNGDMIGVIAKEIMLSEDDRLSVAKKLADMMLMLPDKFLLTVFIGSDVSEEEKGELESYLYEKHPDAEIYLIDGRQEIYPYIFAAE